MSVLALTRPDAWNWALLTHVGGAMILVGAVLTAGTASAMMGRDATGALARFSYRTLLFVGLPGLVLMRAGAAWIYDKEGWTGNNDPTWLGIGFAAADFSALLFIIALITGGIGMRRMRRGNGGHGLLRTSGVIALILLAIYVVAVWAMAGKPA